jgi:hypothetical protein
MDTTDTQPVPDKFLWDEEGAARFRTALTTTNNKNKLMNLLTQTDPCQLATDFEHIINEVAAKTLKKVKTNIPKPNNSNKPKWMTKELMEQKKLLERDRKAFLSTPSSMN